MSEGGPTFGIAATAQASPDKPAMLLGDAVRTYGELDRRINRTAHALRRAGIGEGDRVAVALYNSFEWFEMLNALGRVGAQLVPVGYRGKGPEIAYMIADSGARLLVADARLAAEVDRALDEHPLRDDAVWVVGDGAPWRGRSLEEAIAREPATPPDGAHPGGGYNVLIYTSGTTGRPKGIVRAPLPPERVALQMLGVARMWGFGADDVHLVAGPVYHTAPGSGGQMHLSLGATIVIMPRFDAEECLRLIERHRVTNAQMVPAMFFRILGLPEEVRRRHDLSSVRKILHAAAPCPIAVKQRIMEVFPPGTVWEFYGASEGGGTRISPEEWLERPGSVGRPWPGLAVKVLDEDGRECAPREVGTIYLSLAQGAGFAYSGADGKTRAAFRGEFFTVGDMGWLDEDGYLYIADRKIDMIITGGANVYPAEVEQVLYRHPKVLDVAVIGVPDDEMGEAVKAIVELRPGEQATAQELIEFCRRDLAHYKCPKTVDLVAELPREPQGKVLKRELRERYWAGRDRRV
ncbi:MAG: AMP-binding protein [Thermodesulfobacteriota bacterium]